MRLIEKPSELIYNLRRIGQVIINKRRIGRIVLNGYIIWPKSEEPYLQLEKDKVFLHEYNNFQDTNDVYTNTDFQVS